ncbi:hypothetical protein AB0M10_18995 [Streptomyces sp. NPDC051840]|uniref:hypothetical protein n=1 Tax=Streptomyces sp. NPDC051840 TaxID=3154752 RepID=UPI003435B30C
MRYSGHRPARRALGAAAAAATALISLAALPSSAEAGTASAVAAVRGVPADGKVMMVMGQDSDTLSDYRAPTCWTSRRSEHPLQVV